MGRQNIVLFCGRDDRTLNHEECWLVLEATAPRLKRIVWYHIRKCFEYSIYVYLVRCIMYLDSIDANLSFIAQVPSTFTRTVSTRYRVGVRPKTSRGFQPGYPGTRSATFSNSHKNALRYLRKSVNMQTDQLNIAFGLQYLIHVRTTRHAHQNGGVSPGYPSSSGSPWSAPLNLVQETLQARKRYSAS